jgi:hypothetical protein
MDIEISTRTKVWDRGILGTIMIQRFLDDDMGLTNIIIWSKLGMGNACAFISVLSIFNN